MSNAQAQLIRRMATDGEALATIMNHEAAVLPNDHVMIMIRPDGGHGMIGVIVAQAMLNKLNGEKRIALTTDKDSQGKLHAHTLRAA